MRHDEDLYFISMAARELGMHPQTLRKYERLGLVRPTRTVGSVRLYARPEIDRLRLIKQLVDEEGVNLAGVQRLLSVVDALAALAPLLDEAALARQDARRRLVAELARVRQLLGM
ncbi:MAG: MerR family transcriptional regulator [Vicinamibacteraceae bacterium]|nr:MerR family transcriptional regulator [Vicinamibacteraceae bacterium]